MIWPAVSPALILRALAVIALGAFVWHYVGLHHTIGELELHLLEQKAAVEQAAHDAEQAYQRKVREIEQAKTTAVAAASAAHQEELVRAQEATAVFRADLDAARVSLRKRFTCPSGVAAGGHGVGASTPAPGREPDGGAGLLHSDAEFLIGESRRCDARIRGLQSYVRAVTSK